VANLYEIVPLDYWKANRGFTPSPDRCAWKNAVLSDPAGRKHVLALVRSKWKRSGKTDAELDALGEDAILENADPFFFGSHDLLVSGVHYPAEDTAGIRPASSGDLSFRFHRCYMAAAAATAKDIYDHNPMARYVAVFQNYLPGAGASFEHLHKQILGVDEIGPYPEALERAAAADPSLFNRSFLAPSASRGWTIARNPHAVAVAAFGIPHPAFWVFSTSGKRRPWELSGEEMDGFSDILHACHAASGSGMPSNEEWAYSAPGRKPLIPFHVTVRWRPNIHAGFEGDTGIFISPLRPDEMRNRLVEALQDLRKTSGRLGDVEVGGDPGPDPIPQPE
jgi:galactose-1-phosphate uridylyltransferase